MNWWQKRQQTDLFVKKRKQCGVLSRSYFKIEEIYDKYKVKSRNILELGAAPGGWTEYMSKKCKRIVAVDLLPIQISGPNIEFIQKDIRIFESQEVFDTILSDVAPNISGNLLVDNAFMEEMVERYFFLAKNNLKESGTLIFKSFQWECNELAIQLLSAHFEKVKIFKPHSSRRSSAEIYMIFQEKRFDK
jgi:23S rRNA (uridine2552-2'-O)-methyltransferase